MTDCEVTRRALTAFVDGELVGEERDAVIEHLRGCAACRRVHESEVALVAAIRGSLPQQPAPPELRERITRLAGGPARPSRRPWLVAAAAAAAVAALALFVRGPREAEARSEFVTVAVDSHLRFAADRLPLEVRSDKPEDVSRFFAGRVAFNVTLPDYQVGPGERKFYDLEGGRLVSLAGDYGAYVAYRMDARPISLLVASSEKVHPSGRQTVTSGALTFHMDTVSGLNVITWSDKGLTYALVSDLSVTGERSCLVCHGSLAERKKIPGFSPRPGRI